MTKTNYNNWLELTETGYYEKLDDGRLALTVPEVDGIVDFHTHLGWTILLAKKVDVTKRTPEVKHNFLRNLAVDFSVYSGQNMYNERPKWGYQDFIPEGLSRSRRGKHHTHTIPNILWEMDALKIEKAVSLALDIWNSDNSLRFGAAMKDEPRMIHYCAVHPKSKTLEADIEKNLELGALGMKVHPELQQCHIDSPEMVDMVKLWKKVSKGLPVLFHSGFNGYEPDKLKDKCRIENYVPVIDALEGSTCIIGHASMTQYKIATEYAEQRPYVYLEIGGQPRAHLLEMIERLGSERLLYGSDWPVYPQAIPICKVLTTTEGNYEARMNILRDNANRILSESEKIYKTL